ncbi:receptor-type tyrosine-protein phosphatase kappa-like [Haliotis rufescens]|uniref:receptor-type tyrosine-protein phosphatase kappa-like n=1 Tax=Haliotis rufescens TaxID=6454 RepID=UPI00201E77B7|nr:receptor-type tyrosine-protein phosphatase kappa-like [Haliotis rufescens]
MAGVRWLILTAAVSGWWIQLMLGTPCQGGRFGDMCSYSCHCTPHCNQTTGICNGTCDPGWFGGNGQTCQRGNVAYNKTATSSATDYASRGWTADKAVDGNRDQDVFHNSCFHSHSKVPQANWTVHLGQLYRIHDIRIYHRTHYIELIRTAVLSLSNSSSSTPGVTCYTFPIDTVETSKSVYDVTCDGTGRYFTIRHSTLLNLCEVEIYVCSIGSYGQNCSSCTDRKCAGDSPCDQARGTCVSGCEPGWMSEDCTEACSSGSYGQNCSNYCTDRKCAGDSPCDHIRGTCVSGCEPGWIGEDCSEACDVEHYGANCKEACASRHCEGNSSCNSTGHCDTGCETGWTGADCTASTSPAVPVAAVGGAVAGLVLLVLVLVLLIIIRRRRNRGNRSPHGPVFGETSPRNRKLQGTGDVYMNVGFEENESVLKKKQTLTIVDKDHGHPEHPQEVDSQSVANQEEEDYDAHVDIHPKGEAAPGVSGCSYYNLGDLGHVIPLSYLEARVREIENHPQEAFERLPGGFTHSYGESQKAGNKGKNRFKGYYPYDYNRVVLHDDSDGCRGDYINASYLDGYKTDNRYIAAQGPYKSNIIEDFWRMIWQEGCTSIVMVTGLVEAGKKKCLQYWPSEKGREKFGDVMVTVETETRLANYTITKLAVENEKESEKRDIYHLHFTSWPDHGVPDTAALLDFMWRVKVISGQQTEPIIVHCSAGIGRTGTYIAIESLVEQAVSEGVVDVVSFVSNMRGQRKNMIQTKEQYLFVYQAVARAVTEGDTSLDCDLIREMNLDHVSDFAIGNRTVQQHIKAGVECYINCVNPQMLQ